MARLRASSQKKALLKGTPANKAPEKEKQLRDAPAKLLLLGMTLLLSSVLVAFALAVGSQDALAKNNKIKKIKKPVFETPSDCIDADGNSVAGPNMTIVIYNNSQDHNIYPVLLAGAKSSTDQWMRGCFRITDKQLPDFPFPRASQYRMYVNCCDAGENGIPPNGMVEITLPFYSPLVPVINPKTQDPAQFIDWWQGGGINMFKSEVTSAGPPPGVLSHWQEDLAMNRAVTPHSNAPSCTGLGCSLHFFSAPASISNWEPQQLIEYTLGAAGPDGNKKPGGATYIWVPNNVDYDVSNVNYVYMPAAIEPYGNSLQDTCCPVGWVGSTDQISTFEQKIGDWQSSALGMDWPRYVDLNSKAVPKATVPGKVPSALEIFLNFTSFDSTDNFDPAPSSSPPIQKMVTLWQGCRMGGDAPICEKINDVTDMFQANFENYQDTYLNKPNVWKNKWGCGTPPTWINETVPPQMIMLAHFYGWGPFNESCGARVNLLENTPGYTDPDDQTLYYPLNKEKFDQLQYSVDVLKGDYGDFDPYVSLVHGPDYLDARYTYAYSVDDALGNMQTDGTGLIIAVGGPENLPNPSHVTAEVSFAYGYESSYTNKEGDKIHFTDFGRCTETPLDVVDPTYTAFVVPAGIDGESNSILECDVTLSDNAGRKYQFQLKDTPSNFVARPDGQAGKNWPSAKITKQLNEQFIDCSALSGSLRTDWCENIFAYKVRDTSNPHKDFLHKVIMPAPPILDAPPKKKP